MADQPANIEDVIAQLEARRQKFNEEIDVAIAGLRSLSDKRVSRSFQKLILADCEAAGAYGILASDLEKRLRPMNRSDYRRLQALNRLISTKLIRR